VLAIALSTAAALHAQKPLSIIPAPLSVSQQPGSLEVSDGAVISYPAGDRSAEFDARHLADLLERTRHLGLVTESSIKTSSTALIALTRTAPPQAVAEPDESYDLVVSPEKVVISAAGDAGLYYGTVTLWQMLTTGQWSGTASLPCVRIRDAPQLRWRGLMLDSARHMQSIDYIRQLIDRMSLEKLNVLHWHLTDDQGWRLEIKRYPRLTQIGAWRELRTPDLTMSPAQERSHHYGGYYTQAEVRDLVAYAAQRNVTIVPEIEMPGHASAALAAYPRFGSSPSPLSTPSNEYGIFPNLYNIDDATFTFLENVLTEVMQLFPSPWIHIGGDEAIKNQWEASPAIQAKMKALGLPNEDALQSYFTKRIDTFLTAHGRRTVGWDEILQGGLAPNAVVMSWHGVQGAIDASKLGHDAVLTPARPLYFNYRQSAAADEAPGRFALNTLKNVYDFDPEPASLSAEQRRHILGVQANLWTEYVISSDRDDWMLYPRTAALAEIAWSAAPNRDWNSFLSRLIDEMRRYQSLGIHFDPATFRVRIEETLTPDQAHVVASLDNMSGFGTVRYTTDNSRVTTSSPVYVQPLTLALPTHLRAAAFHDEEIPDSSLDRNLDELSVRKRFSQQMKLCTNDPAIAMEPDPPQQSRPVVLANYLKPCWIYQNAELSGINKVSAGVLPLPYVFRDRNNKLPPLGEPHTPNGELDIHLDTCTGRVVATLPFPSAADHPGVTSLQTEFPALEGKHDLCITTARPRLNPLWVVNWIQLVPRSSVR
jgi:hexosaminidase